jgi:hypothetical protein
MHRSGRLLAALALGWLLAAQALPAVEATARTAKYAADIERLAAAPAPAPGGVLLIGSSIFRKWTTCAADLAPLPVTNHAFGGSQTPEQLFFFDQLVPSSRAGVVVWYCGSNDVNAKRTPADVLANTREWLDLTRAALPGVRVVLVSVIRAPQKRTDGKLAPVDEINRGLHALGEADDVDYLDVNPALEDAAGEPLPDCYVADQLHLTPEAYRRLTAALRPVLEKLRPVPGA